MLQRLGTLVTDDCVFRNIYIFLTLAICIMNMSSSYVAAVIRLASVPSVSQGRGRFMQVGYE